MKSHTSFTNKFTLFCNLNNCKLELTSIAEERYNLLNSRIISPGALQNCFCLRSRLLVTIKEENKSNSSLHINTFTM